MNQAGRRMTHIALAVFVAAVMVAVCALLVAAEADPEVPVVRVSGADGASLSADPSWDSGTYVLEQDLVVSYGIIVEKGVDLTIDLNGWNLSITKDKSIVVRGSLTLTDGSGSGRSHIVGYDVVVMEGTGRLAVEGITIDTFNGADARYVIENKGTGTISVTDSALNGNGAISSKGDVTVSGSTIVAIGGNAFTLGKAASLHLTDSNVEATGSGIYGIMGTGSVVVDGGTIRSSGSSGILLMGRQSLEVNDALVRSTCTKGTGIYAGTAGIEVEGHVDVTVNGGIIIGVSHGILGSAEIGSRITVSGASVTGGVGIMSEADVTVSDGSDRAFITGTSGAGIEMKGRCCVTVTGGSISGATYGISVKGGTADIRGGTILGSNGDIGYL